MELECTLVYRSRFIIRAYEGWTSATDRVLDIGCGNAVVTDELRRYFGFCVEGTDVMDYRRRPVSYRPMTGPGHLACRDGEFDVCMLNDVLHHCQDWKAVLREALRVGKRVLIFEVEPTLLARLGDWLVNKIHNPRISVALGMQRPQQWQEHFGREGWRFEFRRISQPKWYPFVNFAFQVTASDVRGETR